MRVIEFVNEEVVDGNNVETTYYSDGDVRVVTKNYQGLILSDVTKNDDGIVTESTECTYYENGQKKHEIVLHCSSFFGCKKEETQWREDGQELLYKKYSGDEIYTERVYQFYDDGSVKEFIEQMYSRVNKKEEYYPNGTLKYYEDPKKIKEYYPNGTLRYYKEADGSHLEKRYDNGVIEMLESRDHKGRIKNAERNRYDGTPEYRIRPGKYSDDYIVYKYNDKGLLVYEDRVSKFFMEPDRHYEIYYEYSEDGKLLRRKEGDKIYDGQNRLIYENNRFGKAKVEYNSEKKIVTITECNLSEFELGSSKLLSKFIGRFTSSGQLFDKYHIREGDISDNLLPSMSEIKEVIYEIGNDGLLENATIKDDKGQIVFERTIKRNEDGIKTVYNKRKHCEGENIYCTEYKDNRLIFEKEQLNSELIFLRTDDEFYSKHKVMVSYCILELKKNERKCTNLDANGNIESIVTRTIYSDQDYEEKRVWPGSLKEEIEVVKDGLTIFRQKIGAWGKLVELYEYYPENHKSKRRITTEKDGSQKETHWDLNGNVTFYQERDIKGKESNQAFYPSGRVRLEVVKDGVITYWDNDKNNIKEKRDKKGKIIYQEYSNAQRKFEIHEDGSSTKWYKTGEVLSQTDKDGKETFYYKDGKERMVIEADGTKNVTYDGGQFLLISGRHCDKYGEYGGLTELGEKQAENIGKFIAYASQGKITGLPNIVLPEVYSTSNNGRSNDTAKIILNNLGGVLSQDVRAEKIEGTHNASSELSIHSLCEGYDTADDRMGSIAFSVVSRDDGFVIDRVVFNAEQIAKEVERVEKQEKLMQQTKRKIEKFKEETLERDRANSRIALLREVLKDNVSDKKGVVNPKRSEGDKKVIRKVINETLGDGRK